ncbi:MAG TPA: methyltransferase domain-containing protein [Candidatus Limnocylindrales bacterium]|nr:methyltransferase domain-containing protein [Candidatus Limnocylindrales bacterium]
MNRAINTSVRLFSESFTPLDPVVEIGSLFLPGYEKLSNLRPYFKGLNYIGCDIRRGLGVDLIVDAHTLSFTDGSVGTVLLFEILEHLPHPEKAIAEARRILRDDGLLALSVPFNYRLHGFPTDYWRFTSSGVYTLLADFPDKVIFALGPKVKPAFIFAVAAKRISQHFIERKALFQSRVQETFQNSRLQGHISVLKERSRDFFGHLLGRAELSAVFFDPSQDGGYISKKPPRA